MENNRKQKIVLFYYCNFVTKVQMRITFTQELNREVRVFK